MKERNGKSEMMEMFDDLKELRKEQRDKKLLDFQHGTLLELEANHDVSFNPEMCRYTISGQYDYYPKSNKLLVRKKNKWYRNGLMKLLSLLK